MSLISNLTKITLSAALFIMVIALTFSSNVYLQSQTVSPTRLLLDTSYSFTPASNSAIFNSADAGLVVNPGLYTTAPSSGNKYVCRVGLKVDGKADADSLGGYAANTSNNLLGGVNPSVINSNTSNELYQVDYNNTIGGCNVTFGRSGQNAVAWFYKIKVVEIDSSGNEVGKLYQANTGYYFQLGAVGVVVIG